MLERQNSLLRSGLNHAHTTGVVPKVPTEADGRILTHKILDAIGVLSSEEDWYNELDSNEEERALEDNSQSSQTSSQGFPQHQEVPVPSQFGVVLPPASEPYGGYPLGLQFSPHQFAPQNDPLQMVLNIPFIPYYDC